MFSSKEDSSASEEDLKLIETSSWMIRPCSVYINEYSDCTSMKGRFSQYYTDGHLTDCSRWDRDRHDCRKYMKEENMTAGARIIRNEKQRIAERMKSFKDNDIMKERIKRPPANWNTPLPYHIEEKHKGSYLAKKMEELSIPYDVRPNSSCVLS